MPNLGTTLSFNHENPSLTYGMSHVLSTNGSIEHISCFKDCAVLDARITIPHLNATT